jgi:hypothetical protein
MRCHVRASIALLLAAAASLWSVQALASKCDFATPDSHCSCESAWSSQNVGLPAGCRQPPFVQAPELNDHGRTQDLSESNVPLDSGDRDARRKGRLDGEPSDLCDTLDPGKQFMFPEAAPLRSAPAAAALRLAPSEASLLRAPSGAGTVLALFEMAAIPEPGSWALSIAGLLGMYAVVRRRTISS